MGNTEGTKSSRVHLRIPYRNVHPRDPKLAYLRWQAFIAELHALDGLVIAHTADHIDIAVAPVNEAAARDLARRLADPAVHVVPVLTDGHPARTS
jgi:hypothetical protein